MKNIKNFRRSEKMAKRQKKKDANQPDVKCKSGIFQLAAWKQKKTIPAKNDFDVEREVERVNICLTAGIRKKGEWKNIPVWFRSSQFANLKEIVDTFAEELKELNGTNGMEREVE
jgi:hypothetical protein